MLQSREVRDMPNPGVEESLLQLDLIAHTLMHPTRVEPFLLTWTRGGEVPMHDFFASESLQLRASREIVTSYRLPVLRPEAVDRAWKVALISGWRGVKHVHQWLQQALLARWARVCIDGSTVRLLRRELGESTHDEARSLWPALAGWTPPQGSVHGAVEQCRLSAVAALVQIVRRHSEAYAAWWRLTTPAPDDAVWTHFGDVRSIQSLDSVLIYGSFDAVDWTTLEETLHQTFQRADATH